MLFLCLKGSHLTLVAQSHSSLFCHLLFIVKKSGGGMRQMFTMLFSPSPNWGLDFIRHACGLLIQFVVIQHEIPLGYYSVRHCSVLISKVLNYVKYSWHSWLHIPAFECQLSSFFWTSMYCLMNTWNVKSKMPPPAYRHPGQMPPLFILSVCREFSIIFVFLVDDMHHCSIILLCYHCSDVTRWSSVQSCDNIKCYPGISID